MNAQLSETMLNDHISRFIVSKSSRSWWVSRPSCISQINHSGRCLQSNCQRNLIERNILIAIDNSYVCRELFSRIDITKTVWQQHEGRQSKICNTSSWNRQLIRAWYEGQSGNQMETRLISIKQSIHQNHQQGTRTYNRITRTVG